MKAAHLIFPHQFFADTSLISKPATVFLVEEFLFFRQFRFHKQKLVFHRASMKAYENLLQDEGYECVYIESSERNNDIRELIPWLAKEGFELISYTDPCDNWLESRIKHGAQQSGLKTQRKDGPGFLNTVDEISEYFQDKKSYFQFRFYRDQRSRLDIMMNNGRPAGGKWSFDADNRRAYPRDQQPPPLAWPSKNKYYREAVDYVSKHFPDHYGQIDQDINYPVTHKDAEKWFDDFLENRFHGFGRFQDAIVAGENWLHHSLLSPLLNTGLINPAHVLDRTIQFAEEKKIPINSLEGFVRQLLGWREYIRAVYLLEGSRQRTTNFWGFSRKIPSSFYEGNTGIEPVDATIRKLLKTGYNHHIERLMILSNFMLLCEFDPDEVYRWFMEMYIDSYDWVMVPNVYGMGQFADGGLMSTKPYISSSNYVVKMSDFKKEKSWTETWDALFWRFIEVNRDFFLKNPRMSLLVRSFDRMKNDKRKSLRKLADQYLDTLSVG